MQTQAQNLHQLVRTADASAVQLSTHFW